MKNIFLLISIMFTTAAYSQDSAVYTQTEIIYGRKDGMALTMLRLQPKENAKGKALVRLVSGNWVSSLNMSESVIRRAANYIKAGYTVFVVMHGSQPRYSIADETEDIRRAVRFIRFNAKEFGIDADHIGITGSSSGGHLSLMTALADDKVNPNAKDPTDRVSSRVQAAAVFFPPTDFLNWGQSNTGLNKEVIAKAGVAGAFDFKKQNAITKVYEPITDEATQRKMGMELSPINNVSSDDPPVFIVHGDADPVVPLQQSQSLVAKLKEAGVKTELVVKPGGGHGWRDTDEEEKKFIEWFDRYLK